ncbi:MAG: rhomboid family intramembrane serine protease [Methylotenera sp.]
MHYNHHSVQFRNNEFFLLSIIDQLKKRQPAIGVTYVLIAINLFIFIAMLFAGAGLLHQGNNIQLSWGANFGPATQDGQWWRLFSAIFLHFGIIHLSLNSIALWDVGELTERMYGSWRLLVIYLIAGLFGNLLSLVVQGNQAVSGGASGAIFGLYGALLIFLWRERHFFNPQEFKWFFGGGILFSCLTIFLGFLISGIDNAAHIGGFAAGTLAGIVLIKPMNARIMPIYISILTVSVIVIAIALLLTHLPPPKYKWSDELALRNAISALIFENQAINRNWLELIQESKDGHLSFEELAGKIDNSITQPYEESFSKLSQLPNDPNLPSAKSLENWLLITEQKKNSAEALANKLRKSKQP